MEGHGGQISATIVIKKDIMLRIVIYLPKDVNLEELTADASFAMKKVTRKQIAHKDVKVVVVQGEETTTEGAGHPLEGIGAGVDPEDEEKGK